MAGDRTEREDIFWTLFDISVDPMAVIDVPDGTYSHVNDAFVELFGYPRAALIGQPAPDPVHWTQADRDQMLAALSTAGIAGPYDIPVVVGPGSVRSCSFTAVRIEVDGSPCNLAIIHDVTQLREAQTAAQEQAEQWSALMQQIPGIVWTTDTDFRYASMAGGFFTNWRTDPSTFAGLRVDEPLTTEEERAIAIDGHRRALAGDSVSYEARFADLDFACRLSPLRHADGEVAGVVGIAFNVTEQLRAQRSLELAADRLGALHDLYQAILSARNPRVIAQYACERIRTLVVCDRISVSVFDESAGAGTLVAAATDLTTSLRPGYTFPSEALGDPSAFATEGLNVADLSEGTHQAPLSTLVAEGIRSYLSLPLTVDGELIGALSFGDRRPGRFTDEDRAIAQEVAGPLAIAFQQARLREYAEANAAELEMRLAQLRESDFQRRQLLAQVVRGQEEERRRIANDIHDDSIQKMAAVGLRLDVIRHQVADDDILGQIDQLSDVVGQSITRLRRLMFELWPPDLERYGLAAAIRADLIAQRDDYGIAFRLEDDLTAPMPLQERIIAYRIAQEALANVRRHADASRVRVTLTSRDGGVLATISDDGRGLPAGIDASPAGHMGLSSMRERAELAGGWLTLTAAKPRGTRVEFYVPADPD